MVASLETKDDVKIGSDRVMDGIRDSNEAGKGAFCWKRKSQRAQQRERGTRREIIS